MPMCPVCEHQQSGGAECEVCGKSFGAPASPQIPILELDGLEANAADPTGDIPVLPIDELEPANLAVGEVQVQAMPDMIAREAFVEVPVERIEISEDRVPVAPRTVLASGPSPCRYCGTVQASGLVCERCGMRLPKVADPELLVGEAIEMSNRCKACGAQGIVGQRCKDCGQVVAEIQE